MREGRFIIQRSRSTGRHCFPPRSALPGTGETDLDWVEPSGLATVYAVTVVSRKPEQGGNYNIAIVELDEGPRMMTRIVGIKPEKVQIGMRVQAMPQTRYSVTSTDDENVALLFEPTSSGVV